MVRCVLGRTILSGAGFRRGGRGHGFGTIARRPVQATANDQRRGQDVAIVVTLPEQCTDLHVSPRLGDDQARSVTQKTRQ